MALPYSGRAEVVLHESDRILSYSAANLDIHRTTSNTADAPRIQKFKNLTSAGESKANHGTVGCRHNAIVLASRLVEKARVLCRSGHSESRDVFEI